VVVVVRLSGLNPAKATRGGHCILFAEHAYTTPHLRPCCPSDVTWSGEGFQDTMRGMRDAPLVKPSGQFCASPSLPTAGRRTGREKKRVGKRLGTRATDNGFGLSEYPRLRSLAFALGHARRCGWLLSVAGSSRFLER
jgi:hypothetical protein